LWVVQLRNRKILANSNRKRRKNGNNDDDGYSFESRLQKQVSEFLAHWKNIEAAFVSIYEPLVMEGPIHKNVF
jgi:hypothetical protein